MIPLSIAHPGASGTPACSLSGYHIVRLGPEMGKPGPCSLASCSNTHGARWGERYGDHRNNVRCYSSKVKTSLRRARGSLTIAALIMADKSKSAREFPPDTESETLNIGRLI